MPDEFSKAKLMLLLQIRGKACELESKMLRFEQACIGKGSMFKAMHTALLSIDKDAQRWVTEMETLLIEWRCLHEKA